MKRKGLLFVALLLLGVLSLCLVACDDTKVCNIHSGGTATCVEKAECSVCGETYGELGEHNYGVWTSNNNGTHSKVCSYESSHVITENCSGGTATEEERAVCEVCNSEYGTTLIHTHNFNKQEVKDIYLSKQATCTERAKYYYSCLCGEKGSETFEFGEPLEHNYGEWVSNGNNTHTKTCSNDNNHKITENCNGGTATCTTKAVCDDCNTSYGQLEPHVIDKEVVEEKYLKSKATCTEKAKYYYSCSCGAVSTETFEYGEVISCNYLEGVCEWCSEPEPSSTEGLTFTLINNDLEYEVSGYNRSSTEVYIASTHNGRPVTSIGDEAFYYCDSLTSVTIGNSVTSIGERAFRNCNSLTSVTIGDSVTSIGSYAFSSCDSLTSIEIPDSVTSIGYSAFLYCDSLTSIIVDANNLVYKSIDGNLYSKNGKELIQYAIGKITTSFSIPDSVTSIGDLAFGGCSLLTSIEIPDSVTSIGSYAFYNCTSLTSIIVDANNLVYKSIDGNLYSKNGKELIQYAIGKTTTSFSIPDSVTSIGAGSFAYCDSLTSVTIGDSVTSIGESAFYGCTSLTNIKIPNRVTSIGNNAFDGCTSLTSVTIGDSVTSIGDDVFFYCTSLASVTIGNSVTSIGVEAFYACSSLTKVNYTGTIDGWVQIDFGNNLANPLYHAKNLYVNDQLVTEEVLTTATKISDYAFCNCDSLTSVTIPDSVTSIGQRAFYSCDSLTSVTIGNSVTSIGGSAFSRCTSLTSVTIPDSVTSIGDYTFEYCRSLTSITIPDSVTSIGDYAFSDCDSLTSITIPDSVTSIGDYAFYYCKSLTSVTIGNSVTSIGDYAFYYCKSLTSVTIGNSVTSIGEGAFAYCDSLTSVTIPDSVTTIGKGAFRGCTSLQYYIEGNLKYLGNTNNPYLYLAGVTSTSITSATINENCRFIGDYAFYYCKSLTSVTIGNSVTSIGYRAFYYCKSLTSVEIPDSVTSIGDLAFYYCRSLTSVVIGDSVTSIGYEAFYNCDSLTRVTFSDTSTWYRISGFDNNAYDNWQNKTGGTEIDVTDASNNAGYLDSTDYWYKI